MMLIVDQRRAKLQSMNGVTSEFIAKYKKILQKDPESQIFALLGEALRKSGQLEEAYQICRRGVAKHPHFASGHVAMAKVYIDQKKIEEAAEHLTKAVALAPENIMAHSLLAQLWLDLRRPKEALKSFKMVLLLNPNDPIARKSVSRLESLTADEFDEETFKLGKIENLLKPKPLTNIKGLSAEDVSKKTAGERQKAIERLTSLADAFLVRNQYEKALETLEQAAKTFGSHPEIQNRIKLLKSQEESGDPDELEEIQPLAPREERVRNRKIQILEHLMLRINEQRQ